MSYPNFGKVKTIVLPCPDEPMSIEEYKNAYGIDLRGMIVLKDNNIEFKNDILESSLILLRQSRAVGDITPLVPVMGVYSAYTYESGVTPADTKLLTRYNNEENGYYGIQLKINEDVEFKLDNLLIQTMEF